jgi:hypothetical protein
MADQEQIRELVRSRAPFSTWLGIVMLFFLFGAIVLAVIGPAPRGTDYEQQRAKERMEKVKSLQDDAKSLTTYAWIDKNKGTVRIPIERAMELTLVDLANKKPAPAGPIAAASPPVGAQAPAAATPAPNPSPKPPSILEHQSDNRSQPALGVKLPVVPPGTQPGPNATPAASAVAPTMVAPQSPTPAEPPPPPGPPLPVRGKEQTASPSPKQ